MLPQEACEGCSEVPSPFHVSPGRLRRQFLFAFQLLRSFEASFLTPQDRSSNIFLEDIVQRRTQWRSILPKVSLQVQRKFEPHTDSQAPFLSRTLIYAIDVCKLLGLISALYFLIHSLLCSSSYWSLKWGDEKEGGGQGQGAESGSGIASVCIRGAVRKTEIIVSMSNREDLIQKFGYRRSGRTERTKTKQKKGWGETIVGTKKRVYGKKSCG